MSNTVDNDKWEVLKEAARNADYQVSDDGETVQLRKDGQTSIFSRSELGRITGYQQACVFLARQGIKPRK